MPSFKVIFFGNKNSGKTQLTKLITTKDTTLFEENMLPTIGAGFTSRLIDANNKVHLWDLTGDKRFTSLIPSYYKNADVGVCCVDLTEKIDEQEIKEKIDSFHEINPKTPVILVGTKSDHPRADVEAFKRINIQNSCQISIITSAKNGTGVEDLFAAISTVCLAKRNTLWDEAVGKLVSKLAYLPFEKTKRIEFELEQLKRILFANSEELVITPQARVKAIENFSQNCEIILEGQHPTILKSIASVAAAAVVTIVAALVGFGVGFALGLWAGPGAFITGLIAGCAGAVAVTSSSMVLGAVVGGITAHGLFKTSNEIIAANEFTAEVSSWNKEIIL